MKSHHDNSATLATADKSGSAWNMHYARAITIAFIAWFLPGTAWTACDPQGSGGNERIVQSGLAELGEWPGFSALRLKNNATGEEQYFCGGAAVHGQWVVTAAHCISLLGIAKDRNGAFTDQAGRKFEVVLGVQNLNDVNSGMIFDVADVAMHEEFKRAEDGNDIALVKLAREWKGPLATATRLPVTAAFAHPAMFYFRVAGFGASWYGQPQKRFVRPQDQVTYWAYNQELKYTTVPEVPVERCDKSYQGKHKIGQQQLCGGQIWGRDDSCSGDSGGPLVSINSKGCPQLIEVVSWGLGCATPGKYGVYTRVSAYESWMSQKTAGEVRLSADFDATPLQEQQIKLLEQLDRILAPSKGKLELYVSGGARWRLNDVITLGIMSGVDGRLILIDIEPNANIRQIFPNKFSGGQHSVHGGKLIKMPDEKTHGFDGFQVTGGRGRGIMIGIVVPSEFAYDDMVGHPELISKEGKSDKVVKIDQDEAASYLIRLVEQLQKAFAAPTNKIDNWGYAQLKYEVVEQ